MGFGHLLIYSVIGLLWWLCVFTFGLFQVVMWSIVITAVIGLWMRLTGRV